MRLVQGRFFTDEDDAGHPPVLIITERTARRLFPNGSPVGQSLRVPSLRDAAGRPRDSQACTVVGVIADVKYAGLAAAPGDVVYRPFAQQPWIAPYLVVRTASDPAAFVRTLRRAIASTDPNIVVSAESTLDAILSGVTAPERYQAIVLVSLTLLALGIAGVGLYGVVAYSVAQRTPELGIRMALGAAPASVRRMVLREGLAIAGIGLAAGIAAGLAFVRLLGALLYGIEPTDVPSFGFAALALGLVALAATYVPARRAARLDPLVALRSE
jgi:putative ABC transport system permease protein